MFFLHWDLVKEFAFSVGVVAAACGAVWLVRQRRNLLRVPVIVLSSPIAILAALLVGLQLLTLGCDSSSGPLYSPDHDKLVRVTTHDAGAAGGNSQVELLTHRGFSSSYVYMGGWKSVDIRDIHWIDDSHVSILYDASSAEHDCESTKAVKVDCGSLPPPLNSDEE